MSTDVSGWKICGVINSIGECELSANGCLDQGSVHFFQKLLFLEWQSMQFKWSPTVSLIWNSGNHNNYLPNANFIN